MTKGSDSTYEGLKLAMHECNAYCHASSDSTYEGLKP